MSLSDALLGGGVTVAAGFAVWVGKQFVQENAPRPLQIPPPAPPTKIELSAQNLMDMVKMSEEVFNGRYPRRREVDQRFDTLDAMVREIQGEIRLGGETFMREIQKTRHDFRGLAKPVVHAIERVDPHLGAELAAKIRTASDDSKEIQTLE